MRRTLLIALLALVLLAQAVSPAQAERRVALVIGNGAYKTAPLKNPTNDAQDMADTLREMGFDVTLKLNASLRDMEEAVRAFGVKLKQGGLGLFYYAGHGVQVAGENYLIPVDTKVEAEADVKFGALNAGLALARMEDAGNDFNIVILDACRTNPFARSFRTAEQGLARMDAPKGSLIAYATAPGRVAADSGGSGRNGVYTSFLLKHMRAPGQKIEEVLKRVRSDVVRATKDKQVPWESSSLIGDFYFVSGTQVSKYSTVTAISGLPNDFAAAFTDGKLSAYSSNTASTESEVDKDYSLGIAAIGDNKCAEAIGLIRPKADTGYTKAQALLGGLYANCEGITRNYTEAIRLSRLAAQKNDSLAQLTLGNLFYNGHGVAKSYSEAFKWYTFAGEQGEPDAQYNLGVMYAEGQGAKKDHEKSAKWYRLAAEQGDPDAQFQTGVLHMKGQGVRRDYAEAVKWFRLAADQGDSDAQLNLALRYAKGQGVPQDHVQAYVWASLAAAQGDTGAIKLRDLVAQLLTSESRAQAQKIASQWKPVKTSGRDLPQQIR